MNNSEKKVTLYLGLPMLMLIFGLFISAIIRHGINLKRVIFFTEIFIMAFILVYFGSLSRAIQHKRLKIYSDGIVPSIIPFLDLTLNDVFLPYNEINRIEVEEHQDFDDLYDVEIYHTTGKIYKINSKWFFQYKVPDKGIRNAKEYLLEIKEELEKEENVERRKKGQRIVLFESD